METAKHKYNPEGLQLHERQYLAGEQCEAIRACEYDREQLMGESIRVWYRILAYALTICGPLRRPGAGALELV